MCSWENLFKLKKKTTLLLLDHLKQCYEILHTHTHILKYYGFQQAHPIILAIVKWSKFAFEKGWKQQFLGQIDLLSCCVMSLVSNCLSVTNIHGCMNK